MANSSVATDRRPVNALTVDIEDYFQVEAFAGCIDRADWDGLPHRVEANVECLLALFAEHGAKATFFTLGWVAKRYPASIRRLVEEGHELASHGYGHARITGLSREDFREDVVTAKKILEDVGGIEVTGYRAPSFSIVRESLWAHAILAESGYRYSSSVAPLRHDLYGMPEAPKHPYRPVTGSDFLEIPVSTVDILGKPMTSGGGFFRLVPYTLFHSAWQRLNAGRQPFIFYFHPWEIDPGQPRQHQAPLKSRLRHYARLNAMQGKITRALQDFSWGRMDEVYHGALSARQAA